MSDTSSIASRYEGRYEDGIAEVDGLRLHYTDWNPNAEHAVLLLHGLNVQLHTWDPIADRLSDRYRVVCMDLRGHGDSDWAPDYKVQSFVADLQGLIAHLNLAEVSLVGHSLGARIVLAYAGEHPGGVRHVALSDTGPEVPRAGALAARAIVGSAGEARGFSTYEKALEHFNRLHPEWQPEFVELHALHQLRHNWAGKLTFKADPELYWITGSAGAREIPYLWEMCAEIQAPVLIMWGEESPFFDEELIERMRDTIPRTEVAKIPGSGHYIPRQHPDVFTDTLRDFLDR